MRLPLRPARWFAACMLQAAAIGAQVPVDTVAKKVPVDTVAKVDTAKHLQVLFTVKDGILAAGVVGATIALFPVDRSMAVRLQNENLGARRQDAQLMGQRLRLPRDTGRVRRSLRRCTWSEGSIMIHNMQDLGWHTTEAALVGIGITGILKGFVGRSRPFVSADTNPHDFGFGKGFTSNDRSSFPSGHATIAFAAAAAATSEVSRMWPKYRWIVGPILYGSAALVGFARMYQSQHWASDVVIGAGIGTFSGLKVVRYAHAHPDNFLDRVILNTHVTPSPGGGGTLSWSMQLP